MNEQVTPLAVQNLPLLRAIAAGGAASPTALAEAAGILPNHVHRKLDALEEDGLIVRTPGGPKHEAMLTSKAEAALKILSYRLVPANRIKRWDGNPRTQFDEREDEDMARSVGDKGVLQPLTLRPCPPDPSAPEDDWFEVIIGERRRRGSVIAVERGWQPANFMIPADIRHLTDEEALEIAGVENLQREDMHWMDEALWYLRLATRPQAPLSGAAIERLVGGARKKRSIQDYTKIARELPPELRARCYLPDGHKDLITYVQARDMVGDKKEKPALALSPKLALHFLEALHAGFDAAPKVQDGPPPITVGKVLIARFYSAPVGGPYATLQHERQLLRFAFHSYPDGRFPAAEIRLTEDVVRWLKQIGYDLDPAIALRKIRADVLGDMVASTFPPGRYFTQELNAPEVKPEPIVEPGERPLTPREVRVLVEIAHKVMHDEGNLMHAIEVPAEALLDTDLQTLVERELVAIDRQDEETAEIALDAAGDEYLDEAGLTPTGDLDCPALARAYREDSRGEARFVITSLRGRYSTPWLRIDLDDDTDEDDPQLAEVEDLVQPDDPLDRVARRTLREIAARSLHRHRLLDGYVQAQPGALADAAWQRLWDLHLVTKKGDEHSAAFEVALTRTGVDHLKTRGQTPEVPLSRNSCTTEWLREPSIPPSSFGEALGRFTERAREGEPLDPASLGPAQLDLAGGPTPDSLAPPAGAEPVQTPPAPAALSADQPDRVPLPPMLAIVMIEIAHKTCWDPKLTLDGATATAVSHGWHKSSALTTLIQTHGLLKTVSGGQLSLVRITDRGLAWLSHEPGVTVDGGKIRISGETLLRAQETLLGVDVAQTYSTAWLNAEPPAEADTTPANPLHQPPEPQRAPAAPLDARSRLLVNMDNLLERLDGLLSRYSTGSGATQAQKAEISQYRSLIANTREAAKPHLPERA